MFKLGMQDEDGKNSIALIQERLGLTADGIFDNITEKAVIEFQMGKGIRPDGIVGEITWRHLFAGEVIDSQLSDQIPKFKYFNYLNLINPYFDDNPAKNSWFEMPEFIQKKLEKTARILDDVCAFVDLNPTITSTWRPKDGKDSPHFWGAIDSQFLQASDDIYIKIMEWLKGYNQPFRAFLEWEGYRPWLHLDTDFQSNGGIQLIIGYPYKGIRGNKMIYQFYDGRLPKNIALGS